MKRIKLRHRRSGEHALRRRGMGALVGVGAFGAAAEGVRRWRHRHSQR